MEEKYIENRLSEQITWYDDKSRLNKEFFTRLRLTEIIAAAIIPF